VYSQQTAQFYGGDRARQKVEDHIEGYYHALVEARIPFDMMHDGRLDAVNLAQYRVMILPNIAALSERQCNQIREFVRKGGGVVATYETSLYDEWGARRPNFALTDLFGAAYAGGLDERMMNSYLNLETDPRTGKRHPLLSGLSDAERIINGVNRVRTKKAGEAASAPLTLIPSYPDLPMEEVFPRTAHTDQPEVYASEIGGGRVVYFPWDVDRTFWEVLSPDHGKLLRNAVDWAANEPRPVEVEGPGLIDLAVWQQKNSMTVHMVNLTNAMAMKGPLREFIPLGPLKVTVRMPSARKARQVKLLTGGQQVRIESAGWGLRLTIPRIVDHEVIAIDFA
jgi:hypothetical protein